MTLLQATPLAAAEAGEGDAPVAGGPSSLAAAQPARLEIGATYSALHSNLTSGQNFWLQGGGIELATPLGRGFGLALDVSRSSASNIQHTGDDLTLLTAMVGPRYTWSPAFLEGAGRRWNLFGEALLGVADVRETFYPAGSRQHTDAFGFQLGGGLDFELSRHWSLRPLQVDWVRTSFRNGTTDVQNNLRLSAGIVFRFPVPAASRFPVPAASVSASLGPAPTPAPIPSPPPPRSEPATDLSAPAQQEGAQPMPVLAHQEIMLPGVVFETDSARLLPQSMQPLDAAAAILKQHPNLAIEVQGYTDSRGSQRYNLVLSQNRAESVVSYLEKHGVTNTIDARGYGKSRPVADNSTEEGRQQNRRVVLRALNDR